MHTCVVNHPEFWWSYFAFHVFLYFNSQTIIHHANRKLYLRDLCVCNNFTWAPRGLLVQQHRMAHVLTICIWSFLLLNGPGHKTSMTYTFIIITTMSMNKIEDQLSIPTHSRPSPLNPGGHGPQVAPIPGAGMSVQLTPAAQGDCWHPSASFSQKRPVHAIQKRRRSLEGCISVYLFCML